MTDIRALAVHEIPTLLPLARQFHESLLCGNLNNEPLDEQHFQAVLRNHLTNDSGFVLVAGSPIRGMICGIMFDDMSTAARCCMEFFWYVDQAERGSLGIRLLNALEAEAESRGAVRVLMAHLASEGLEKFTRVYERRGYALKEQVFVKPLKRQENAECAA